MSFPLAFQDLYTDVGQVNSPDVNDCDGEAKEDYGCPAQSYDFSTTNDTDHGSSGSPIFNVVTGEVVGVASAGTNKENANFTWSIYASQLNDF
jgi:hypothetical protein